MISAQTQPITRPKGFVFWRLFIAGFFGIIMLAGMMTYLVPQLVQDEPLPPNAVLWAVIFVQYGIILAVAVWGGLTLTKKMQFNPTPILTGELKEGISQRLMLGAISGFVAGLMMLAAYQFIFVPLTLVPMNLTENVPLWLGMGNAFLYGGITEELLMRLGLMSLLLWIAAKIQRSENGQPNTVGFWTVNVIVTIIFGLLHLPSTALITPITPMIVVQALVLNSVALLFGWLYWRRGLETAIMAHITVHVGYTLIGILLFG